MHVTTTKKNTDMPKHEIDSTIAMPTVQIRSETFQVYH